MDLFARLLKNRFAIVPLMNKATANLGMRILLNPKFEYWCVTLALTTPYIICNLFDPRSLELICAL